MLAYAQQEEIMNLLSLGASWIYPARMELFTSSVGVRPSQMTPVGFEPTQLALVELESTPLDHSGKVSWR